MIAIHRLIRTMNQINGDFHEAIQQIINDHPNFDTQKDSRITIFTNCIVALDGVYICFIVRGFELRDPKWWTEKESLIGEIRRPKTVQDMDIFVKGFDSFTVTAYFNLLFIALENGFRTFYKIVCPTKGEPGRRDFNTIYEDILKELQLDRYLDLMKILRKVRNALTHQNGIHDRGDDQVIWRNTITITFTKGKPVDYGGEVWEVLPSLLQGIVDMLKDVVNSNKILQENQIIDPSYV
jgi:hypothetical protein